MPAVLALIFSLCASLSAVVIVVILLLSQMTIGNFQTSERIWDWVRAKQSLFYCPHSSVPCCWSFGEKTVDRRLAWTDSYHNNDNEGEKKVMVLMVVKEETKLKGRRRRRRRRRQKRRRRRNRGRWRQIWWLFFLWIDRARSNLHCFVVSVTVRQVPYHHLW